MDEPHHSIAATPAVADFPLVPARPRHDGWSPERQRAFIAHLADSGSVSAAAEHVGMSTASAYALRRRADARGFDAAWAAALQVGRRRLIDIAYERAVNGTAIPIFHRGEQVGERIHHDNRLLMFLIANPAAQAPVVAPPRPVQHAEAAASAQLRTEIEEGPFADPPPLPAPLEADELRGALADGLDRVLDALGSGGDPIDAVGGYGAEPGPGVDHPHYAWGRSRPMTSSPPMTMRSRRRGSPASPPGPRKGHPTPPGWIAGRLRIGPMRNGSLPGSPTSSTAMTAGTLRPIIRRRGRRRIWRMRRKKESKRRRPYLPRNGRPGERRAVTVRDHATAPAAQNTPLS